jgi:hypothetical protein
LKIYTQKVSGSNPLSPTSWSLFADFPSSLHEGNFAGKLDKNQLNWFPKKHWSAARLRAVFVLVARDSSFSGMAVARICPKRLQLSMFCNLPNFSHPGEHSHSTTEVLVHQHPLVLQRRHPGGYQYLR